MSETKYKVGDTVTWVDERGAVLMVDVIDEFWSSGWAHCRGGFTFSPDADSVRPWREGDGEPAQDEWS